MSKDVLSENAELRILPRTFEEEMEESYGDYAMSVIVARALPDARDGLKPVHRRILYSMNELGLEPSKAYKKSARIVGDTMAKYHPHGDSSIYEAMVRLAQPFSMRYLLVDGHGNFGSIDGDDAAAQRYTEVRMLKLTTKMLEDLDKNTVDFVENYDGELEEPTVLPAKLPNLLVNGASGIAVGMATNMPPHNLNEVVDAICKVIDNKVNENRDTNIDEVIEVLSAPDFPTGGVILGTSGIKEAYRTGRGKLVLRAKARIDVDSKGRQSIVVTEIPYQVTKSKLVEKIAELVKDKKIEGISDLRDESDRNGIRIVIEVRRDANANIVLNQLYKFTQMQVSFGIINLALVNGEPKLLNLLDLINVYLEHQKEVVTRRTHFELDKAEKRAHIIEGLFIALDHIDEVINIIRASKDGKEAKGKLVERFGLSDEQANAIVEMRLRGLTGLERDKLQAEYDELVKTIAWLKSILADEKVLYGVVRQELVDIAANFGDKRRTEIANTYEEFEDFDVEDLIPDEQCVVTMTTIGYIKRLPVSTYKSQKRGGRGVVGMQTRDDDTVQHLSVCMTHDNILFFTGNGRVYCKKAYEIPEAGRNAKGTAIVNLLKLDPNEKIKAIIPVRDLSPENKASFIMMTKYGTVKKTPISEFANIRQPGIIAINILDGDELVQVDIVGEDETIFVATNKGLGSRFKSSDVRNMGRSATGVRAMQTSKDNYIIGFAVCSGEDDKIIFVSEQGFGKATFASEFPVKNRGLKGMLCYNPNEKTGQLTCVMTYNAGDELLLVNSSGIVIRIKSKDIPILGRHTRGSKLITIDDGEYITSVTKVVDDDED